MSSSDGDGRWEQPVAASESDAARTLLFSFYRATNPFVKAHHAIKRLKWYTLYRYPCKQLTLSTLSALGNRMMPALIPVTDKYSYRTATIT